MDAYMDTHYPAATLSTTNHEIESKLGLVLLCLALSLASCLPHLFSIEKTDLEAMDDVVAPAPLPTTSQDHLLRRRSNPMSSTVVLPINLTTIHHQSSANSISATPTSSSSTSTSSSLVDFDFISIKPVSYTSLRDLLPSTPVNSPKPNSPAQTGSDISIKNRLVKQAAWAYLQPMSTCPDSSARNFLHRLWSHLQLLKNQLAAFRDFVDLHIFRRLNQAFDWLLRAVRVRRFS